MASERGEGQTGGFILRGSDSHQDQRYLTERHLPLYSGNDNLTLPLLALGAQGVISVAGNVIPATMREICYAYFAGDTARARQAHLSALALMDACMAEVNPIPVKTACAMMGLCREEFRLPLCPMQGAAREHLAEVLREYGMI